MSRFGLLLAIALAAGSLARGYGLIGLVEAVRWMLVCGAIWMIASWNRWIWVSGLGLLLSLTAATLGLWYGFSVGWMLAGALGGLLAWNLSQFQRRLRIALWTEDLRALERLHLARVTIVALAGLGLTSIVMRSRGEFTVEWGIVLGLAALLAVIQLLIWYRKK